MKVTLAFACDTERDADIVAWAERQENRSSAIRAAIRASWLQGGLTLGDVLNELGEVKRLLRSGVGPAFVGQQVEGLPADPEIAAVQTLLDTLGSLG